MVERLLVARATIRTMLLGLVAGNTSLRFGLFSARTILEWRRIDWAELDRRGSEISALVAGGSVSECVAGSVRDDLLDLAGAWLPRGLWPPQMARRDFPIPIENRYLPPEDVGTDRLLNALAVRELSQVGAAVAVDFGTAVSVSVVSWDRVFVGGAIAAGGKALARGLKAAAPRLPLVEPAAVSGWIQNRTVEGVQSGVYWQVAGGVRAIVQGILRELGPGHSGGATRPRVFATGGEAYLFAPAIAEIDEVVPELTLQGLAYASSLRE